MSIVNTWTEIQQAPPRVTLSRHMNHATANEHSNEYAASMELEGDLPAVATKMALLTELGEKVH